MATSETTKTFTSKADARRLNRRLRDHGILSKCEYARGLNKVTILVPGKFELAAINRLCDRIMCEAA
jgi:hypothetical protein